jgi:UDP-4-amino-4,6-dideoxy-N-acetyl-beta-L-altrosamine N-acetyltransferase
MHISKYGIDLTPLDSEELELVRTWRNDPAVADHMFFQEEISPEMQETWFDSLDDSNLYWMIVHNGNRIGVINVKNIDWTDRTGEAGIFIGEASYRNSPVCMMAIAAMMDVFFDYFDFTELRASIKKGNENALDFNQKLGYEVVSETENAYELMTNAANYARAIARFKPVFLKWSSDEMTLALTDEERKLVF